MKKITLLTAALLVSIFINAKIVYVTTDGNNSNTGASWDTAVKDLSTAYSKATAGDQIWMAGGIYAFTTTINMIDEVDVYGGFAKGDASLENRVRPDAENEPWKFTNETVLTIEMPTTIRPIDRDDKNTSWKGAIVDGIVLKNIETTDARVAYFSDGVTFQNSAIINCSSASTHIYFERNCVARNCLFEGSYNQPGKDAAAIQLRGSKDSEIGNIVENCVFRNNKAQCMSIYNTATVVNIDEDKHVVRNCSFLNNQHLCISMNNQTERPIEILDCLFEGNVATSNAATSPHGTIITGGTTGIATIARCIIQNNKNEASAASDWKNCLLSLNSTTVKIMNSLVINNSCAQLSIYNAGDIYNCTIANNQGSIYGGGYSTFMNNAMINNSPTEGRKVFFIDSESNSYFLNNAISPGLTISGGGSGFEVVGTIEAELNTFVTATSFVGVATNDSQVTAINNSDFSLANNSVCINKGDTEELLEFVEEFEALFSESDLAGNKRFSDDGKINIGAYQGGKVDQISAIDLNESVLVYGANNNVIIETPQEAPVAIYDLTGKQVSSSSVKEGNNTIPVNVKGLYIVKVGTKAYKVYVP